jgi:chemotaxis protein CheD
MELPEHYLYPSNLFAHRTPHLVHTILGSCVAVCLWDPARGIGGINHYMLPLWNGQGLATPRYGNIAIEHLIDEMSRLGCHADRLEAKIFGGARVLNQTEDRAGLTKIGDRNIDIATTVLHEHSIPIVAQCVGGHLGFKLRFKTDTGEVLLKRVQKMKV